MSVQFSMSLLWAIALLIFIQQVNGQIYYTDTTCSSPFEDISATGNPLDLGYFQDEEVPIGFDFEYYCGIKGNMTVHASGYLWSEDHARNYFEIAPLYSGLDPSQGGEIDYITLGEAPNRYFIAQWSDVPHYSLGGTNTFQAMLEEQSNCIEFRYEEISLADDDIWDIDVYGGDHCNQLQINATNLQSCHRICRVYEIQCPEDITLECGNTESEPSVPLSFCNGGCGTEDCSSQMSIIQGDCCSTPSIQTTFTRTTCPGEIAQCTQTVTIEDTTPPQITCPSNVNILLPRDDPIPSITGAATCSDSCDLVPSISFTDTGVQGCDNILSRKWICTDDCGNEDRCTQDITFSCTSSESEDDSDSIRGNSMGNGASSDSNDGFAVFNALFGNGDMDNDNMDVNNQNNMNRDDEIQIQFGKSVYLNIGVMCGLCLIVSAICAIIYKAKNKNNVLSDEMETIV